VCRDLSPERANAILEYLYHHNVCNSVSRPFWTRSDHFGPVLNTADPCRPMLARADQCGVVYSSIHRVEGGGCAGT